MADITMCRNEKCPLKKDCYRSTAKPSEYQSYATFEYEIDGVFYDCEYCECNYEAWNN